MRVGRLLISVMIGVIAFLPAPLAKADLPPRDSTRVATLAGDEFWSSGFHSPGPSGPVNASVSVGDTVYIGGVFRTAGNVVVNNVAAFNRTTGTWSPLGFGFDGSVSSLVRHPSGDLYAGGTFLNLCGDLNCTTKTRINHIARWNGAGWVPLAAGVTSDVRAIAVAADGTVYAGGLFSRICLLLTCESGVGQIPFDYRSIAAYNPSGNFWTALKHGLDGAVQALATSGNDVLIGGFFTYFCLDATCTTADPQRANGIVRWKPNTNNPALSQFERLFLGVKGSVQAIAVSGAPGSAFIYVGGAFTGICSTADCSAIGGNSSQRIARYSEASNFWQSVGYGVDAEVYAITILPGEIPVAGGAFQNACLTVACGTKSPMRRLVKFVLNDPNPAPANWSPLPLALGVDDNVLDFVQAGSDLLVFGVFVLGYQASGPVAISFAAALTLANETWVGLGSIGNGASSVILTMAARGRTVYVGGQFRSVGRLAANFVAAFDDATDSWSRLGNGLNGAVRTLLVVGNDLYAGGLFTGICQDFTCSTTTRANGIARWDGTSWQPVGFGLQGEVSALAYDGTTLFAAGAFVNACQAADCGSTTPILRLARFDGTSWQPVGFGLGGSVLALAYQGSILYVGGLFDTVCTAANCSSSTPARKLAKVTNGSTISPASNHVDNTVYTLLPLPGGEIVAGGDFSKICPDATCLTGTQVNRVVRFQPADGSFGQYGFGLNGSVRRLAARGSEVLVAGQFLGACNTSLCNTTTPISGTALSRGGDWFPLGSGSVFGTESVANVAGSIYVGGFINQAGDEVAGNFGRWRDLADLRVTITGAPSSLLGQTVTYTITVANNGSALASDVVVSNTVPSGITVQSVQPSAGSCGGLAVVVCRISSLGTGGSATIVVTGIASGSGRQTSAVVALANQVDPAPANNTASISTDVASVVTIPSALVGSPIG